MNSPYFSLDVAEIQYICISPCATIDQLSFMKNSLVKNSII